MWSDEGVDKGLREAFHMRNDLFHEVKLTNPDLMSINTRRFQFIFELFLMKVLEIDYRDRGYKGISGIRG